MIKYFYCDDINIIKKKVLFDTSFLSLQFNTSELISSINMVDMLNPVTNFLIKIDEIKIEDISFVHNSIVHEGKNIYFILPEELQKKKLDYFEINNFEYEKIDNDENSCFNF